MAIYSCYRHGKIEVVYLEIGEHGTFPTTTFCPGSGPSHSMVLQSKPDLPDNMQVVKADEQMS